MMTKSDAATTYCLDCNAPTTNKVFCPHCLDADSSIQPHCPCGVAITGPGAYCTSRCVRAYAPKVASVTIDDEATIAFLAEVEASGDEAGDGDDTPAVSTSSPKPIFIELRHVTHDHTEMCASCNSKAVGECRCGRRVCGGCVDGETGLCAYCDDVVEDAGVEAECYA